MQFIFLFKLKIWNYIQHDLGSGLLIQKRFYISFYILFHKFINFKTLKWKQIKVIISSSFSYLLFHWRCFNVSLFRQCSIVVLCCSAVFRLFRQFSVVPSLFRCSVVLYQPILYFWTMLSVGILWTKFLAFEPSCPRFFQKQNRDYKRQHGSNPVVFL